MHVNAFERSNILIVLCEIRFINTILHMITKDLNRIHNLKNIWIKKIKRFYFNILTRYRGLKSFRNSSWDPSENLPDEYSRVFKFENFKKTFNSIVNSKADGAKVIYIN